MFRLSDFDVYRAHLDDVQREVARERLARQAMAGRQQGARYGYRMRSWLARRLIEWGMRLQKRDQAGADPLAIHGDTPRQRAAA